MIVIGNGMLRSGSTLQYNVAASVLETAGPLTRLGFLGDFDKPKILAKLEALKASDGWTILKTHEAPLERDFYDDRVRVLFSYHDVRDIAASINKKWGHPFEQILSDIDALIEIERSFGDTPNVLVQPYEKLYADLPAATHEIAQFLGEQLDDAVVASIVAKTSVHGWSTAKAQHPSRSLGRLSRPAQRGYDAYTLLHPDHVSATGGKAGDWKRLFNEAEIAMLGERFGDWLTGHGYQLSMAHESRERTHE